MSKKSSRKSNGALDQDTEPTPLIGFTDVGDDEWKPPNPKDGAWDCLVQSVDTVVRENTDGELWGYLIWNEKNEDGRFYRSKAKLPTIYRACPQRVCQVCFGRLYLEQKLIPSLDATFLRKTSVRAFQSLRMLVCFLLTFVPASSQPTRRMRQTLLLMKRVRNNCFPALRLDIKFSAPAHLCRLVEKESSQLSLPPNSLKLASENLFPEQGLWWTFGSVPPSNFPSAVLHMHVT